MLCRTCLIANGKKLIVNGTYLILRGLNKLTIKQLATSQTLNNLNKETPTADGIVGVAFFKEMSCKAFAPRHDTSGVLWAGIH